MLFFYLIRKNTIRTRSWQVRELRIIILYKTCGMFEYDDSILSTMHIVLAGKNVSYTFDLIINKSNFSQFDNLW